MQLRNIVGQGHELGGHLHHRQDDVDQAGFDGMTGHRIVLGVFGQLGQGHPARLLDAGDAHGAIGAGAGQQYTDGMGLMGLGQGAEKLIDRHVRPQGTAGLDHTQYAVEHVQVAAWGNQVHMVALDTYLFIDLDDRQR
ncbi:hypothetical protein D3C80_884340 [compost metagenome]